MPGPLRAAPAPPILPRDRRLRRRGALELHHIEAHPPGSGVMQSASSAAPAKGLKQARPGPATQERSPRISRAKDPQPPTGRDHCPGFAGLFRLAPKVRAALGERSPRQGPVSPPANDDLDRGAQALPPACKTEFRPSRPCPKRCAKFENGRLNFRAPSKFSSRPRCLLSFSTQARTAPFILHPSSFILSSFRPGRHVPASTTRASPTATPAAITG